MFSIDGMRLKKIKKILRQVNHWTGKMSEMTDVELKQQTGLLKQQLREGVSLDDMLPQAFATIREADKRVLGKFPYDVQVLGAIVLHQGNIAEMKTGEGKTLTATLPIYLNALTGKGVMLITTNSYLASRDAYELGKVYEWLGLTLAVGVNEDPNYRYTVEEKKAIYQADILYTTNDAVGFDYLQENLVDSQDNQFLRPFNYAILDEVDAILLDSAQTPLIISGSPRVQSNLFHVVNQFVLTLSENSEYDLDDERKHVWLTTQGIEQAKRFFEKSDLFSADNYLLIRHIELALQAKELFKINQDYVINGDEIKLLDSKNGRVMSGTKLQAGLHQAIEAKEGLTITQQTRAMASITYQNLFRMFKKLAGMTGTGKTNEEEFIETYNMTVIAIPTHRPIIRKDLPDKIYVSLPEKLYASMALVKACYRNKQPVLLATGSVEISEIYSQMLLREGIPHNVLNARNIAKEAAIIAEAGQLGSVTVATAMAGRGTDIKLGKGVAELGGLAVIGTERMTSMRIDLQLRGRAGRQGDPGFSQFFVSLEDDIIIKRGSERTHRYYKKFAEQIDLEHLHELTQQRFKTSVDKAQFSEESQGRIARLNALEFDESMRIQRTLVYEERNKLLRLNRTLEKEVLAASYREITLFLQQNMSLTPNLLKRYILDHMNYNLKQDDDVLNPNQFDDLSSQLLGMVSEEIQRKRKILESTTQTVNFQRLCVLKAIDVGWVEQVDNLQQLRQVVTDRKFSQQNPLFEYQKEAIASYQKMCQQVDQLVLKNIMLSTIKREKSGEIIVSFP
ncbi:accessory Sec system translocase SecA2 [Leuconostoc rapi]|uniref:accessory Sec system translocase SecA2 n=1 Tax=Leuconostoc rapi TaxID=1406906 RepID=UPI00195E2F22|nr:accessory Sec system translocase SecA2 [Leuconostoc rapi]MBM7436353.1 preprotein translocase subunit SecA [Leuconostoc rapi]